MDNNLIEILNKFENTCYVSSPNLVVTDLSTTNLNHNFWITNELMYPHLNQEALSV